MKKHPLGVFSFAETVGFEKEARHFLFSDKEDIITTL